ncbi:hypothetical protein BU015_12540, partial [Staphylococcus simulans]|uniref:HEPN domain-containing protein n=3 Tax=Staphylococcus simulans TaxID=1286 RepID=UPI000EBDEC82
VLEDITEVCYLFSFVTNQKHRIDSVNLINDDNEFRVFRTLPYKFEPYHKNAYRYEIAGFINTYFGVIYEFYYKNPKVFEDVFSLYIKLMYTTNFIDYYLVDLLKLLEGVHRRLISGKQVNLVERYKEMLEILDGNLQNYLKKLIVFDESIHDFMKEYRHYYSHFWLPEETLEYEYDTNFNVSNYAVQLLKAVILSKVGVPTE